jgi:curved DNA-binding protein CbpA
VQRDYFAILEISAGASEQEIRAAYRRLARRYHPDLHPERPDADERLKELNEAYAVLSDPAQRARYLRSREVRIRVDAPSAPAPRPAGSPPRPSARPAAPWPGSPSGPLPGSGVYSRHVDLSRGRGQWGAYGGVGFGRGYGGPIPQRPFDDEQALLYVRRLLRALFGW